MMRLARLLLLLLAVAAALPAAALDESDLWFDPADPGWGLDVRRQGEVLFAVLFTYDSGGRPTWYVASDVRANGTILDPIGVPVYSGTLYATHGQPWGPTFDPATFSATPVGSLEVALVSENSLAFHAMVRNTIVTRTLQRQTWARDDISLAGLYSGTFLKRSRTVADCAWEPPEAQTRLSMGVGSNFVTMLFNGGPATPVCEFDAVYAQRGRYGELTGPYGCRVVDFTAPITEHGRIVLRGLLPNGGAYSGEMTFSEGHCGTISGTLVLARESIPTTFRRWPQADLWFDPDQRGWGLALHRQAEVTFALLFVYGADGNPTWYVASDARPKGRPTDANFTEVVEGTLYSMAGSALGTAQPAGGARATAVGTLNLQHADFNRLLTTITLGNRSAAPTLQRQTWREQWRAWIGDWRGNFVAEGASCGTAPAARLALRIRADSPGGMRIAFPGTTLAPECEAFGTYEQQGSLGRFTGNYACPLTAGGALTGSFALRQVVLNGPALTARMSLGGNLCADGTLAVAAAPATP